MATPAPELLASPRAPASGTGSPAGYRTPAGCRNLAGCRMSPSPRSASRAPGTRTPQHRTWPEAAPERAAALPEATPEPPALPEEAPKGVAGPGVEALRLTAAGGECRRPGSSPAPASRRARRSEARPPGATPAESGPNEMARRRGLAPAWGPVAPQAAEPRTATGRRSPSSPRGAAASPRPVPEAWAARESEPEAFAAPGPALQGWEARAPASRKSWSRLSRARAGGRPCRRGWLSPRAREEQPRASVPAPAASLLPGRRRTRGCNGCTGPELPLVGSTGRRAHRSSRTSRRRSAPADSYNTRSGAGPRHSPAGLRSQTPTGRLGPAGEMGNRGIASGSRRRCGVPRASLRRPLGRRQPRPTT